MRESTCSASASTAHNPNGVAPSSTFAASALRSHVAQHLQRELPLAPLEHLRVASKRLGREQVVNAEHLQLDRAAAGRGARVDQGVSALRIAVVVAPDLGDEARHRYAAARISRRRSASAT